MICPNCNQDTAPLNKVSVCINCGVKLKDEFINKLCNKVSEFGGKFSVMSNAEVTNWINIMISRTESESGYKFGFLEKIPISNTLREYIQKRIEKENSEIKKPDTEKKEIEPDLLDEKLNIDLEQKTENETNQEIENKKEVEPICPYCKNILNKIPKRKTKCKNCNNEIFIRTKQKIFPSMLLTKEESEIVDWSNVFGIQNFFQKREVLSQKFGKKASISDVVWGLYNNRLLNEFKIEDYHSAKMTYYDMALFLNSEGKDCFKMLYQSRKMELWIWDSDWESGISSMQKVKISAVKGSSCQSCEQLDGKIFTIKEALKEMPIPNKNCTFKFDNSNKCFCRCGYLPVIE